MPGRSGFDFNGSSQSFNVLASYLFGKVFATFPPYVRSSLFCWLVWIIGENTKGLLLGCLPAERSFRANGNDYSCYYSEGWAQQWNDGHDNPGDNKEGERCMLLHVPFFSSCICLVIQGNLLLVRNWWGFTFPFFFPTCSQLVKINGRCHLWCQQSMVPTCLAQKILLWPSKRCPAKL